MKKTLKLILGTILQIPLKSIEKSKENLDDSINFIEQRLCEKKLQMVELNNPNLSQHICQEIIENIQSSIFFNISDDTPLLPNNHQYKQKYTHFKPIQYMDESQQGQSLLFWPEALDKNPLIYGTRNLYVFIRFFYTFYEQMLMAYQLSQKFENNQKAEHLIPEVQHL